MVFYIEDPRTEIKSSAGGITGRERLVFFFFDMNTFRFVFFQEKSHKSLINIISNKSTKIIKRRGQTYLEHVKRGKYEITNPKKV